jgi:hypothetical protein
VILVLLFAHGILGAILLMGIGNIIIKQLARALFVLVIVHTLIGIILTVQSAKVSRHTKALYFRENKSFWIRRISGIAIVILIFIHIMLFGHKPDGSNTLAWLNMFLQLLLVGSIFVHVISNVKPLLVAFGSQAGKKKKIVIISVFSLLTVFWALAMIIYYAG